MAKQMASTANEYAFKGGFPTPAATQKVRDDVDYQRALTAYRFWYPTVSVEGVFHGNREQGLQDNETIPILSAGPRHVVFTANSDTPYGGGCIDVKSGPMVIELPSGPIIASANDHHQGWILDMGLAGPDAGKGGKHLILPPGYKGEPPLGYYAARSSSYKVFLGIRALPVNGDVKGALDTLKTIKIYPLATASNPKLIQYVDITERKIDGTSLHWEDSFQYWQVLHGIIDAEPIVEEFRPMYGLLVSLGIQKGSPFSPDARMKGILERAAKDGRDQLLVSAFDSARPDRLAWKDRRWEWAGLVSENGNFETPAGLDLEARDRWFAQAILGSPAMFRRTVGAGSLYWLGLRDSNGVYLDGAKTYKLTVPQPVPARLFWSVTVYDPETRSMIQTDQEKAALRSLFELKEKAAAKTVDIYFGPEAPAGRESQWIKTIPGKGWFVYFRIYGPEQPAFDGSWKPGDFEAVK